MDSPSKSFRCCVCEKHFPSKKSLYGHMRCHPERAWRGMNPPSEEEGLKEKNERVFVDLSSSLSGSGWLKKDRRGRECIGAAEFAQNLMFLSHGDFQMRQRRGSPPPSEEEEAELSSVKKRKKNNDGSSSPSAGK